MMTQRSADGVNRFDGQVGQVGQVGQAADAVDGFDAVAFEHAERAEREERLATRKLAAIEAGRRKGGVVGAAMAGAMLAVQEIYEGPPLDADIVEVAESPDEPGDIDADGIGVTVGGVDVWAPPPGGVAGSSDI